MSYFRSECLCEKDLNGNLSEMEECSSLLMYCYKQVLYCNLLLCMQYSKNTCEGLGYDTDMLHGIWCYASSIIRFA
jgi:hypothetical protein